MSQHKKNKMNFNNSKIKEIFISKGKIFLFLLLIISSLTLIAFTTTGSNNFGYMEVKISSGDSLWTIVNSHYDSKYNTRKIIHKIKQINDLDNVILQPGQTIKLPKFK